MAEENFGPSLVDVDWRRNTVLVKNTGEARITDGLEGRWIAAKLRSGKVLFFRPIKGLNGEHMTRGFFLESGPIMDSPYGAIVTVIGLDRVRKKVCLRTGCRVDFHAKPRIARLSEEMGCRTVIPGDG